MSNSKHPLTWKTLDELRVSESFRYYLDTAACSTINSYLSFVAFDQMMNIEVLGTDKFRLTNNKHTLESI